MSIRGDLCYLFSSRSIPLKCLFAKNFLGACGNLETTLCLLWCIPTGWAICISHEYTHIIPKWDVKILRKFLKLFYTNSKHNSESKSKPLLQYRLPAVAQGICGEVDERQKVHNMRLCMSFTRFCSSDCLKRSANAFSCCVACCECFFLCQKCC